MPVLHAIFGAKGQVVIGALTFCVGVFIWVVGTMRIDTAATWSFWLWSDAAFIFHASMFFGLVACYAIIATGLGYRATERVEQHVIENADNVETDSAVVERADQVDVGG